jgi:hypothetical protein
MHHLPPSIKSCMLLKSLWSPSIRKMCFRGIPAAVHAATAASNEPDCVIRNFVPAVFRAWDISSTLYAGEAPFTRAPADRCQASILKL